MALSTASGTVVDPEWKEIRGRFEPSSGHILCSVGIDALDPFILLRNRLTGFSGPLARHGSRRGLAVHKGTVTLSRGPEKPASGGQIGPPFSPRNRPLDDFAWRASPLRRLPDAPHRAAHRACRRNRFGVIKRFRKRMKGSTGFFGAGKWFGVSTTTGGGLRRRVSLSASAANW